MKTNKYFTSDRREEYLKTKNDKEKNDDNEESEEDEEYEEEEDEKNKKNAQNPKSSLLSRQLINKDIKQTILKRDDKSRVLNQNPTSFNKQKINTQQNQENETSKDGNSIRRALQGRNSQNQAINEATKILAKKDMLRTGLNKPYILRNKKNSPISELSSQNPQNLPETKLKTQNSQAQMQVKSRITSKIETQTQARPYHSRYSKKLEESNAQNDGNNKEIKIINKSNNYTINVTNNNNTINVTNNNINNDFNLSKNMNIEKLYQNDNKEEEKEKTNIEKKEKKNISKKEPRKEIRKEPRKNEKGDDNNFSNNKERERENKRNIKEKENKNINLEEEENNSKENLKNININQEKENNELKNKNKEENMIEKDLPDGRKEYVSNDIMIQNGVEIVKFSPEETKKVFDKKAEAEIIKKKIKEKKKKFKDYRINDNFEENSYNFHRENYRIFYQRGRDNFSKKNIFEREKFYRKDKYDDYNDFNKSFDYNGRNKNYNNKTFNTNHKFNIIKDSINNNRYNSTLRGKFYERGRPNQLSRGVRGRRGRY